MLEETMNGKLYSNLNKECFKRWDIIKLNENIFSDYDFEYLYNNEFLVSEIENNILYVHPTLMTGNYEVCIIYDLTFEFPKFTFRKVTPEELKSFQTIFESYLTNSYTDYVVNELISYREIIIDRLKEKDLIREV